MRVELLYHTPLSISVKATRTCWNSHHRGGKYGVEVNSIAREDKELLSRVADKYKHESVLEHINYTFEVKGLPRLILQQLARHRHISLSVKSTRYTLKELLGEPDIENNADKFIALSGNIDVDKASVKALARTRELLRKGYSNDVVKYSLPESYKTDLIITLNLRELRHILKLRKDKSAHSGFKELAILFEEKVPNSHKFLL